MIASGDMSILAAFIGFELLNIVEVLAAAAQAFQMDQPGARDYWNRAEIGLEPASRLPCQADGGANKQNIEHQKVGVGRVGLDEPANLHPSILEGHGPAVGPVTQGLDGSAESGQRGPFDETRLDQQA